MRTVEIKAATPETAEKFLLGYDCPAPDAFLTDWMAAGSCRFIGIDSDEEQISVLILSAYRPERAVN